MFKPVKKSRLNKDEQEIAQRNLFNYNACTQFVGSRLVQCKLYIEVSYNWLKYCGKCQTNRKKDIFGFKFVFCLAGFGIVSINRFRYVFRRSKFIHVYTKLFGFVRKDTIYTQILHMTKVNWWRIRMIQRTKVFFVIEACNTITY